ncbi:heterokaryon incompatibility protein-domain-containing protein [Podospora fimiseda]|uniref:Heterokaryon incompatibility protein-domain-containing protein n=1 Tax=Podospora fimiseda TaxID=252190 RepID=A0AAN7BSV6_9PEZI|nr:heterokaryon incompatibility protein-domain-containing protein [Podospora fimiseda]
MSGKVWADFRRSVSMTMEGKFREYEKAPRRERNEVTTSPYQYTQIPSTPTSIRLLHILPGTLLQDIECRLVDADLDVDNDGYEALSYVWGDVSETTPIQVNGNTLQIGKNLRCALLNLRLADRPRILWVDAICINQEDLDERNQQVSIMGRIYQSAQRTVVFLGDEVVRKDMPENTVTAFALINALAKDAAEAANNTSKEIVPLGKGEAWTRYGDDGSSVVTIMRVDWWKRAWTAQEIVLAKRAMLVMGRYQVDWDLFCAGIHYGEALELTAWTSALFGGIMESVPAPFHEVETIRNVSVNPSPNPADELVSYLNFTKNRKAGDPRDKVFAVLGFADRLQAVGITADYRSPVVDVYRDAAKKIIEVSGSLDLLGLCFFFEQPTADGLPSWVPDFGPSEHTAQPLMLDAIGRQRTTHASQGAKASPQWDEDGEALVIQGHVVDKITSLSAIQTLYDKDPLWDYDFADYERLQTLWKHDNDNPLQTAKDILGDVKWLGGALKKEGSKAVGCMHAGVSHLEVYVKWEEFADELKPTNPDQTDCNPLSILRSTLCAGTLAPGGLQATEDAFMDWRETLSPIKKLMALKVDKRPDLFKSLGFMGHIKSTWREMGDFWPYLSIVINRRLGATERGYLCLLPKHTEVGDQVAILKGGRVPVVLRPRDDGGFRFIGETYVHGIMDGEAFVEEKCVEIKLI